MTKEFYLKAKRAAAVRYMETAEKDAKNAKTTRQRNNARRRYDAGKRTLDKIDGGKFWNEMTEQVYLTCYAFLSENDAASVSAI